MISIGKTPIGGGSVYVIAEAGVNHNGDIEIAKKLIDAARGAGADAVKFQTFTPEEMVTEHAAQAEYQAENTGIVESQASMLQKLTLPRESYAELKTYTENAGIEFLSTPFSIPDADFLASLNVSAYKVSSGDLTNLPFLTHLARSGKPVIISTGMATLPEVQEAFETLKKSGAVGIVILQCTSEYPTPLSHANLRVLKTLQDAFDVPIGYSDHTEGRDASIYAVSLGATVIEKHFTLDRNMEGPDHKASLEPTGLREMIAKIRETKIGSLTVPEEILGSADKKPTLEEQVTAKLVRKGIAARANIRKGEELNEKNIFIARPEGPVAPREWDAVLGKHAAADIPAGESLSPQMIV